MKTILFVIPLLLCNSIFGQNLHTSDTIAMGLNEYNTIFIKAIFNHKDTLNLNFDTGTTELVLTNDVLNNKVKTKPELYNTLYDLEIGNTTYKTKVYDAELAGHGTDGRFGWDFFKGKVVEINYDKKYLIIHSLMPSYALLDSNFTQLKMEFYKTLFFVSSEIKQSKKMVKDLFLFDTGFERTLMLDHNLLQAAHFPITKMRFIKKIVMKGAQGNEIAVTTSNLNRFKIGKYELKDIPVQITTAQKPVWDKNVHVLGNEILKRFTILLDFQNNLVLMKPNTLFNDPYIDQK